MASIDWTQQYERYKGLWVALEEDQKTVIAAGETLHEARQKAEEKGYGQPIFFHVPSNIFPQIGVL